MLATPQPGEIRQERHEVLSRAFSHRHPLLVRVKTATNNAIVYPRRFTEPRGRP